MSRRQPVDVSVVVPMYQSAATVRETVESALADFDASRVGAGEVIVVNDGSTDAGPAIVAEIARRDPRVRLVNRDNGGLSVARNTGIDHAAGRLVRFLDADDLAVPGGLAVLIDAAEATGAACGGQELIDEAGRSMGGRELSPRTGCGGTVGLGELITGNAMGVGTVLIARERLGDRRFDPSLPVCEDWDLWLRLTAETEVDGAELRFAAVPSWRPPVKRYRVRAGSLSKRFALMAEVGGRVLRKAERGHTEQVDAVGGVGRGLLGLASGYGTMQALSGDFDGGLAMLVAHDPRPLTPDHLATDAFAAVLLGLGVRPEERGAGRTTWVRRLSHWWEQLEGAGWIEVGAVEQAWHQLARMVVAPNAVAGACVEQAKDAGAKSVVVAGLGKNGRRVVEVLGREPRGRTAWTIRDDALGAADHPGLPGLLEPMRARIAPTAAVIVTPERDEALVTALISVGVRRLVRWKHVLAGLADAERADMETAREPRAVRERSHLRCA